MTRAELVRGDGADYMATAGDGSVDLFLTDPPYGTQTEDSLYGRRAPDGSRETIANDTDLSELERAAPHMTRLLAGDGVALVFMAPTNYRDAAGILEAGGLVVHHSIPWDKRRPGMATSARFCYEDVILATHPGVDPWADRDALVIPIRYTPKREPRIHPNQKPVAMLRRYVRWALPNGGHVCDPFAGVASVGVAAVKEGCTYTGIEIDDRWWPHADERLDAAVQDGPAPRRRSVFDVVGGGG